MLAGLRSSGRLFSYILGLPKAFVFWKSVQREIEQICGINFALDPALYILGILPDNMTDQDLISLVRILPLIAKKVMIVSWLKLQPLNISQWRDRVKKVIMEKITANLQLKTDRLVKKWSPLILPMPDL